jgi:PAS domain S-box-containing protein
MEWLQNLGYRWRLFTLRGFEDEPSNTRKRQIYLFWISAILTAIIFGFFGIDQLLSDYGTDSIGYVYFGAAAAIVGLLVALRSTRWFDAVRVGYFVVWVAMLEVLLTSGGVLQTGILWFYLYPPIAFYLGGRKLGLRLIAFLYLVTVGLFLGHLAGYVDIPYATLTLRQFALSFLMVAVIIYFQEQGRERDEFLMLQSEREIRDSFDRLQEEVAERTKAEAALEARNSLMQLMQTVAVAANEAKGSEEALETALWEVCNYTGWPAALALTVNPDGSLQSTGIWHIAQGNRLKRLPKVESKLAWEAGQGVVGRAVESGRPNWVRDYRRASVRSNPNAATLAKAGVRSAAAFPVFAGSEVAAVIELFSDRVEPKQLEVEHTLGSVGTILGRVIEREHAAADRERLAALVESSADAVIGKTLDGTIVSWNAGAERLTGHRAGDITGHPLADLFEPDRRPEVERVLARVRRRRRVENYETQWQRKDGTPISVSLTISPIADSNGKIIGASTIARDVTERRRIDQMKTDFVSLVSHQLRTPVGQVRGYVENMLGGLTGSLSAKQKTYLHEILEISTNNYDLVTDLLNVSRLERGVLRFDASEFTLGKVVEFALRDYRDSITAKGVKLKVVGPRKTLVRGDYHKFAEALRNVISNALKFTNQGSITIELSEDKGRGVVSVVDTGTGVEKTIGQRLFTRQQIFSGGPTSGGGAGLGMYIAGELLRLQRGKISFRPNPKGGSIFVLSVPLAKRTAAPTRRAQKRTPAKTR